jgi:hypothetical protein
MGTRMAANELLMIKLTLEMKLTCTLLLLLQHIIAHDWHDQHMINLQLVGSAVIWHNLASSAGLRCRKLVHILIIQSR